jgi:hypothetical protein
MASGATRFSTASTTRSCSSVRTSCSSRMRRRTDDELVFLLRGGLRYPGIAVVSSLPASMALEGRESLDRPVVERLAARASVVLVAAWDAQAYVVWEPGPAIR